MTKPSQKNWTSQPNRTLGRDAFGAISAVEGLTLSKAGKDRGERKTSIEARRREVVRAYLPSKRK